MEREKENKELREVMTKIVKLNKKYCEEIKKLKKENEELKKALQEREIKVGKVKKKLVTEEIKSWKEEREQQQKVNIDKIIRQQQQEHNKGLEKQVIKIMKEKCYLARDMIQRKMCVVVLKVKEKNLPMKIARERKKRQKELRKL